MKRVELAKIVSAICMNVHIILMHLTTLPPVQDRDESRESIREGLPVVSFSIGDAADFKYGDQRDVDTADEVMLESGDVLIFGGDARRVFHGVTTIHSNTAPKTLVQETDLRPGRVNLTFRQY